MKKRIITALFMAALTAIILTGCSGANGKIPSESKVLEKVARYVTTESYHLGYVEDFDSVPKRTVYHFVSDARPLEFTAESTLKSMEMDQLGELPFYEKQIYVNYEHDIRQLYYEDALAVLQSSPYYKVWNDNYNSFSEPQKWKAVSYDLQVTEYAQLEACAALISEVSDIYSPELEYHDDVWMMHNPLMIVRLLYDTRDEEGTIKAVGSVSVTGLDSEDEIYRKLCVAYASMVNAGNITDDTVSADVLEELHEPVLDTIYIDGTRLINSMANHQVPGFYNESGEAFTARYNYDLDTYVITLDAGVSEEKCNPHPFEVFIEYAGGKWNEDYNTGEIRWKIDDNKYVLTTDYDSSVEAIRGVRVTRNGEDLGITYIMDGVYTGADYLIMVPVDDVAKMFELEYEVDEAHDTLKFKIPESRIKKK